MEDKTFIKFVAVIAIFGNLGTCIGVIGSWINDSSSKWVWLIAVIGWGLFSAAIGELLKTSQSEDKEKSQ